MFTLFAVTLGFRTRYVLDYTDHVWTEVWLNNLSRWIHCDSCEAAFDTPLVYEQGWGKKLNFLFGFEVENGLVVDVMCRYSRNALDVYTRRAQIITERDLAAVILQLNSGKGEMMSSEVDELENCIYRDPGTERLPGRISGM